MHNSEFRDTDPSAIQNVHVTFLQYLHLTEWGSYEVNTAVQYVLQLILCNYDLILHLCVYLQVSRLQMAPCVFCVYVFINFNILWYICIYFIVTFYAFNDIPNFFLIFDISRLCSSTVRFFKLLHVLNFSQHIYWKQSACQWTHAIEGSIVLIFSLFLQEIASLLLRGHKWVRQFGIMLLHPRCVILP